MSKISDEKLRKLTLPEVPDHLLDRWEKLYYQRFYPQEVLNASKTLPKVSPKNVSGG